ncbi:translation initiation factor IF-3 [Candidatus Dojkabacteria bacterium]|uniref:Translation initiation factor IF-3 n=1 Tax=Candidatus Dojkabacteria bacterium TaxID=2099670 RepID=A0A847ETM4_9BACT|nr:translation initiation factor IF-3 [Candidatus Dojkabacteria bacterium]
MDFNNQRSNKDLGVKINDWIRVPKVLLIDEKGENLGEVDTIKAKEMARAVELDLVEVGATSNPPVCRIMDFSKYIYEQKKKLRKNKTGKAKDLKEFRFSAVIDVGDMNTRIRRAKEFLEKGHPVKITTIKKGRQPYEQMKGVFNEILTNFTEYCSIEPEPKSEFNSITITFKKDGKTKNKQNSNKESKAIQPEGEQESKDDVQTESSGTSQDKEVKKVQKKTG